MANPFVVRDMPRRSWLRLPMEDPDPPLEVSEGFFGVSKPGCRPPNKSNWSVRDPSKALGDLEPGRQVSGWELARSGACVGGTPARWQGCLACFPSKTQHPAQLLALSLSLSFCFFWHSFKPANLPRPKQMPHPRTPKPETRRAWEPQSKPG